MKRSEDGHGFFYQALLSGLLGCCSLATAQSATKQAKMLNILYFHIQAEDRQLHKSIAVVLCI